MLKKSITYEDLNGNEVTDTFRFNFTKLELLETDLMLEGLEDTVKRLTETKDSQQAYTLFKDIILSAYGEVSSDGKYFMKEDDDGRPLRRRFASSPACSEMILEFLQDPEAGAKFIEACLPAKLVAEVKAAKASSDLQKIKSEEQIAELVKEAAARQDDPETRIEPGTVPESAKGFGDYSKSELLAMSNEEFRKLVPSNPKDMTQDQLLIAFERKNSQ